MAYMAPEYVLPTFLSHLLSMPLESSSNVVTPTKLIGGHSASAPTSSFSVEGPSADARTMI